MLQMIRLNDLIPTFISDWHRIISKSLPGLRDRESVSDSSLQKTNTDDVIVYIK